MISFLTAKSRDTQVQFRTKLSLSMITREAISLLANLASPHDIIYLETAGAGTKIAVNSPRGTIQRQKHVDCIISEAGLHKTLDDISELVILPAMKALWKALSEDRIAYTHTLVLPSNLNSARHIYDGFCMRGIMSPKLVPGTLPTYRGESEDHLVRFDVLYSRAIDD